MNDPISESLELAAESVGDVTEAVYRRYFERCPGSAELMSHIDYIVRGRMLEEVIRLIMQTDYCGEQEYLDFEMKNHRQAYSVEPHMYGNLLGALRDTIRESLDTAWSDEFEAAWEARLDRLLEEIGART